MSFDNNTIQIKSCRFFTPLEKNWWRMLGFYLNIPVIFSSELLSNNSIEISYKQYKIKIIYGKIVLGEVNKNSLFFQQKKFYFLSTGTSIGYTKFWNTLTINQDIITPIFKMLEFKHKTINSTRGICDTTNSQYSIFSNNNIFEEDYFLNFIHLIGTFFKQEFSLSSYPYIILLTFNLNDYQDSYNQTIDLLNLLEQETSIKKPTFFLSTEENINNPLCNLQQSDLKLLLRENVEIGLESSAYDQYDILNRQKTIIEKKIGKQVTSHRSNCHYFEWQKSWISQLNVGFLTDLSVGSTNALYPRGTGLPIYFPDSYGKDTDFWTIDTIISSQRLLQLSNFIDDSDYINMFKNLVEKCGVITIAWDIHEDSNKKFPNNFKTLIEILKQASSDGALICGVNYLIEQFKQKWNSLYPNLLWSNNIKGEKQFVPSEDIKNEITTYIDIFNHSYVKVCSIDHSIDSLLSILPNDIEKIADIGCGPGLLARKIPSFYKLICIDLDKKILASIDRYKALGSITDIPLKDHSVELIVAMDILEHLSDTELEKAVSELARVSSKYVYIQTPHNENLSFGQYLCLTCNKISHINHHKQSFDYQRLKELFQKEGLKAKVVNLTGDMTTSCYYPKYNNEKLNLLNYKNKGVVCYSCGETSNFLDTSKDDNISLRSEKIDNLTRLNPWYSEIAILFSKDESQEFLSYKKSTNRKITADPLLIQYNEMDFSQGCIEKHNITFFETIPYYVSRNAYVENVEDGISLYPSQYISHVSFYSCFSNLLITDKVRISINGSFPINSRIACTTFNMELQQIETIDLQTQKGDATYIFNFNKKDVVPIFLFTFPNEGKPFIIKKISCSKSVNHKQGSFYIYSFRQEQDIGYLEYNDKENITWRFLLPPNEKKILFSHNIAEYVKKLCHVNQN